MVRTTTRAVKQPLGSRVRRRGVSIPRGTALYKHTRRYAGFRFSRLIPRSPAFLAACLCALNLIAPSLCLRAAAAPAASVSRAGSPTASNPRFTGSPFLRTWTPEDYSAAPVNYDVLHHPTNGFLYAANNYGVLEFDGVTWRLIEMPNAGLARALAVDANGRIWAGGSDEVAVLTPNAHGALIARSALPRLPEADRAVGIVTFAAIAADGIYFGSARRIFFFGLDGSARAWPTPAPVASLTWLENMLLVVTTDGSCFTVANDVFTPAGISAADPIRAAQRQSDGSWKLLTSRGPAQWPGPGAPFGPIGAEVAEFFQDEPAQAAVFLADGRMAFGRLLGGVAVFDRAGRFLQNIDRTDGLGSNRIEQHCADAEGGLWIAQRSGLARVQLDSPFAKHGLAQGVDGRPRALQRHNGSLYIAHNEGAAWRDDATGQFHPIGGLGIGLTRFVAIGSRLYGTSNAVYEVTPETVSPLIRLGITPLVPLPGTSPDRPWLLGGGNAEAWLFAPEGKTWKTAGALANLPADIASLLPMPDGMVWGASSDGRIWRMDFRDGPKFDAPVTLYGPDQGVPSVRPRDAELFLLGGDVLALSSAWILRHDAQADRFVPETRIAGIPAHATASRGHVDGSGTLWLQLDGPNGQLLQILPDGPARWRAAPLAFPAVSGLVANRIYHDEAMHTLWVASQGVLVSADLNWKPTRPPLPPRVRIRRVETAARELVFGGSSDVAADVSRLAPADSRRQLPADNALRFAFAAPAFDGDFLGRAQTMYRTRLEGLEPAWTPWSADTLREFSNLPFRRLTFRVEARGPDGQVGPADAWAFTITPPWWLTRWMFAVYAMAGLASLAGVVQWRTRTLRRRTENLEATVVARTAELRENNTELARLHSIERDQKLAARLDEEKARLEVLRYQLNPHFLYNTLASICGTARTNPDATRTMAQRLADFCRLTLTRPDETDTVREEVRMLRSYLDIEKARWREHLQIEIDVAEDALDRRLPTFLLLPLLENAIKHGGRTTRGTLKLRLKIFVGAAGFKVAADARVAADVSRLAEAPATNASLVTSSFAKSTEHRSAATQDLALAVEVANTGVWDTVTPNLDSTGIGLENLRRRLARYYPAAHTFTIGQEGEWVVARLRLKPQGDGKSKMEDGRCVAR